MTCPLSKLDKSPIFQFHHMDCHSTQSLQSVNKGKNILCQPKFFQCSHHKQILFLNFLLFPLFCPPPAYGKSILRLRTAELTRKPHKINYANWELTVYSRNRKIMISALRLPNSFSKSPEKCVCKVQ
jgi:hypothetical protein